MSAAAITRRTPLHATQTIDAGSLVSAAWGQHLEMPCRSLYSKRGGGGSHLKKKLQFHPRCYSTSIQSSNLNPFNPRAIQPSLRRPLLVQPTDRASPSSCAHLQHVAWLGSALACYVLRTNFNAQSNHHICISTSTQCCATPQRLW